MADTQGSEPCALKSVPVQVRPTALTKIVLSERNKRKGKKKCADYLTEARTSMEKTVRMFNDQLAGIRTGILSPSVIETVRVDCYEQKLQIKQIAQVGYNGPRIGVEPYDTTLLGAIDSALKQAGFGSYIFSKTQVVVPYSALSGAEREKVKVQVARLGEEAKVAIRNIRKKLRQTQGQKFRWQRVPQDEVEKFDKQLQELTDAKTEEVEAIVKAKLSTL